ncbi:hypothetical protein C789_3109 [Microcystis aeruginosa FACHB-905 = DIANCHI905]|nr:hypothetical protein C789_3109 [Microcystis aeruginosa FACHB-905 = DIANCHI905]
MVIILKITFSILKFSRGKPLDFLPLDPLPVPRIFCSKMLLCPIYGELAQLVERCDRTAEVRDSSSLFSIFQRY